MNNKCPKCGTDIANGLKYCPKCGEQISAESSSAKNTSKTIKIVIIVSCCIIGLPIFFAVLGILAPSNNSNQSTSIKEEQPQQEEKQEGPVIEEPKEKKQEEPKTEPVKNYDEEMDIKALTDYYYEYGYRQGNVTYFGKKIKTTAYFNSSDSSWPKIVYMDGPSESHYSVSCGSFKGDAFKKMSSKNKGEAITFIGKVDELVSSNNYKSGILGFDDCEFIE